MGDLAKATDVLPAQKEIFQEGLRRTGLLETVDTRLNQELASLYIADQFGAWQTRKAVNDEAHQDTSAKFTNLPTEVQQSVARLAELRLAATAAVFSPAALDALIEFGKTVTPGKIPELKASLDAAASAGEKFVIPELEKFMSSRCPLGSTGGLSYTEVLLRIHHGTWHSNLDKPHDFAYREDSLPKDSKTGVVTSKEYPPNLREYSDKANTVNVLTQLAALASTFAEHGSKPLSNMLQSGKVQVDTANPFLNSGWQTVLANLDAGAVINN